MSNKEADIQSNLKKLIQEAVKEEIQALKQTPENKPENKQFLELKQSMEADFAEIKEQSDTMLKISDLINMKVQIGKMKQDIKENFEFYQRLIKEPEPHEQRKADDYEKKLAEQTGTIEDRPKIPEKL